MMVPADKLINPLQHTRLSDAELLTREAIQNSADERRFNADGPVRFSVKRKQYRGDEKSNLVRKFGLEKIAKRAELFPSAHGWFKYDETCFSHLNDLDVPISVLLLSDHNTNGLGGNWRTDEGIASRFYNLVLSMYSSNKQEEDGDLLGSYGVGKMVYAVTSNIRTMAYYSCFEPTESTDGKSARFMATAFFPKHKVDGEEHSGHAFFGIASNRPDYPAEPLVDACAHNFAESVGLEVRSPDDTGLTVMLLDCDLSPHDCLAACEKFWWPRIFDEHSEEYVNMEFFDGDTKLPSPTPSNRPELKPFIDCYSNIRQQVVPEGYDSKKIKLKETGEVGHLCMTALGGSAAQNNDLTNSVALIRSGLVIQYNPDYAREDDPHAIGVFEAIGDYPSKCFTYSEPEAHDKWNFNHARLQRYLGDRAVKLVRRTHERIKESFRDFQTRQKGVIHNPKSEGLDYLDNILGSIFQQKKKGPPPPPPPSHRAFTIHKKGWRNLNSVPMNDNLEFIIALAEEVSVDSVDCEVSAVLKILEEVDARPGTSVSCAVFNDDGTTISSGSGKFKVKLIPSLPLKFRAVAEVHPTWRTRWTVTVARETATEDKEV